MAINKKPIPQRIYNASKEHPYVAGAVDIIDDVKNKHQQQINAEIDSTLELHQSEINALDSQNYETYTADDQTSSVTDVLPATGAQDTVYRVGNWNGEQYDPTVYSEYAWDANNNIYKLLDVKQYTLATAEDFIEPDATKRAKITTVGAVADVYGRYEENPEFVDVKLDKEGRILWGIQKDGNVLFGAGVPRQIVNYIQQKISELQLEKVGDVLSFLDGIWESDETLQQLLDKKVDGEYIENSEFVNVIKDKNHKLLESTRKDGTKVFYANVEIRGKIINIFIQRQINAAIEEMQDEVSQALQEFGAVLSYLSSVESPEYLNVELDSSRKVLHYRDRSGMCVEKVGFKTPILEAERANIFGGRVVVDGFDLTEQGKVIEGAFKFKDEDGNAIVQINPNSVQVNHLLLKASSGKIYELAIDDVNCKPHVVIYEI